MRSTRVTVAFACTHTSSTARTGSAVSPASRRAAAPCGQDRLDVQYFRKSLTKAYPIGDSAAGLSASKSGIVGWEYG